MASRRPHFRRELGNSIEGYQNLNPTSPRPYSFLKAGQRLQSTTKDLTGEKDTNSQESQKKIAFRKSA